MDNTYKRDIKAEEFVTEYGNFRSQRLRDHYHPFSTFVLHDNFLLVAHGNLLSLFDTSENLWIEHINFNKTLQDADATVISTQSAVRAMRNDQVAKIFRYQSEASELCVGVLFYDGSIAKLKYESGDDNQLAQWKAVDRRHYFDGDIISIVEDEEHYRILYVLTEDNSDE